MNATHAAQDVLEAYVMGALIGAEAEGLEEHVIGCADCAARIAVEAQLEERLFAIATATAAVVPKETPVAWRPNAAAALSALTEDAPVDVPVVRAPDPAPPAAAPSEDVWKYVPRTKAKAARWPFAVAGLGVASLCVAAGIVIGTKAFVRKEPVVAPVAIAPTGLPVAPEQPATATVIEKKEAIAALSPAPKKEAKGKKVQLALAEPAKKEEKKKPDDDGGFGDLLNGKKKSLDLKATLSREDVLGTVKANAPAVTKCADAHIRAGGTLPAKLVVRWVITPSGHTEAIELGEKSLKATPLEGCVVAAVKKWQFPEFQSGTIPVTFPFIVAP